jgi:glutamate formiminotransferase
MAVQLENPGQPRYAQVSMNLVDWEKTGIARVVGEIKHMARQFGADIDHCELIGLAPAGALMEVVAESLSLRGFNADQVLELRLARDR